MNADPISSKVAHAEFRTFVVQDGVAKYGWTRAENREAALATLKAQHPSGLRHSVTLSAPANPSKSTISSARHAHSPEESGTRHLVRNT